MELRFSGAYGRPALLLLRRAVWVTLALVAAAAFFCLGLLLRVLIGPVSLGPFGDELRSALNQVVPGLAVRFDNAALEWDRNEGRINLVILGTRVLDRGQHIIAQAPKAEIGLSIGPFLHGRIAISRIVLVGVQLTLVHTTAGTLRLGLQPGAGGGDVLRQIRDVISRNKGNGSPLESIAVREARLAFYDEETGAFLVAPKADLQLSAPKENAARNAGISAVVAALVEISGKSARLYAVINFPARGDLSSGDLSISGLNLSALARDGRAFRFLTPLALTGDFTGSWVLDHGNQLRFADFGIGASGDVNGLGRPLHVKSLRLVGRFDGETNRLLIDDAELAGEEARAHLTGSARLKFGQDGHVVSAFDLAVDRLALDVPGTLEHAVNLGRATFAGTYDSADNDIVLEEATLSGGPLSASIGGRIALVQDQSPELDLDGRIDPIAVRDLLPYWPLRLAAGARAWIAAHVQAGRIGPVLIHTRIPAGTLARPAIPDDAVLMTFPVRGAAVDYLSGLTPLTNASGSGTLTGDNFKAELSSAAIGPLSITDGHVTIADLHVPGTPALIDARISGGLPQFFALLDMKPLQYPTRFHINTATARGNAAFDAAFRVPTLKGESIEQIGISVKGAIGNFALALGPHTRISDGTLNVSVDNAKLRAEGRIDLGAAPLDVDWLELFKPEGPFSTTVDVRGVLDDAARVDVGLPSGSWLAGPIGTTAHLRGDRGNIRTADINFDLTQAVLSADAIAWRKLAGTPASAHVTAELGAEGSFHSANLTIQGPGLAASANLTMAADGGIESISAPSVHAGADNDFALLMKKRPDGGEDIAITGHSLDASALLKRKPGSARSGSAQLGEPFHLSANLDRLVLRDGAELAPFSLDATGAGRDPGSLLAKAGLTKSASLAVSITAADGQRHLTVSAGDAGQLIRALLGYPSVKGGELSLAAAMPPLNAGPRKEQNAPDYAGELTIRDCTILNQPFLTRLFSSGSPGGLVELVRGQGIGLDSVHIPFRVSGDIITIHDARATGPSVGITADGYIDRATNQVALDGAVAPMYGLNGLLGVIPVLGNVFVSKKGEGLFGITYTLHGDLDQPKVATNPLSVLVPGILRRIFEGTPTEPSASATPQQPKGQ